MNSRDNTIDNYICRPSNELPGYMQALILVPENTEIVAGEIFNAEILDTNFINEYGNFSVYEADLIESPSDIPAIVINGTFETLEDGRRPDGNPDYTQYKYVAGDVLTAIRLLPETKFELSPDGLNNFAEFKAAMGNGIIGTWLYPEVGTSTLTWTDNFDNIPTKVYLYIEASKMFRLGGLFGDEFAYTLVVRTKWKSVGGKPVPNPEITAINANLTPDLQVGNENVNPDAVVLTMSAEGGTAPITFALMPHETMGVDNDSFVVEGDTIKVGSEALAEAKTYQIYVEATDSVGKTFGEGFDIPVIEA